jgi:hypothetical protein
MVKKHNKISKKSKVKQSKSIKSKNITKKENKKISLGSYPGFKVAIVFGIIVLIAYALLLVNLNNQRSELAEMLSEDIRFTLNVYIADIEDSLDGEYEDVLEDDYLNSMKDEFKWLQKMEKDAYNTAPYAEVEYKEVAIYLFIDNILGINEMTTYDFGEPDFANEIETARNNIFETPKIMSEDDKKQLNFNQEELEKIENYFIELTSGYLKEKRFIIDADYLEERKYVEAKKINYLSHIDLE